MTRVDRGSSITLAIRPRNTGRRLYAGHAPASRGMLRSLYVLRIGGRQWIITWFRDADFVPTDWSLGWAG